MQPLDDLFFGIKPARSTVARSDHFLYVGSFGANDFAPFSYGKGGAVNLRHLCYSSVSHLLFWRRPSAIGRFVIPVHVRETIYRMLVGRPWSHVPVEGFKTVKPFLAYFYSSASVYWILMVIRIKTSLFYPQPRIMLWRMAHRMSLIVTGLFKKCGSSFLGEASATKCCLANVSSGGRCGIAAITKASPEGIARPLNCGSAFNYQQSSKSLAFKIKSQIHLLLLSISMVLKGSWGCQWEKSLG